MTTIDSMSDVAPGAREAKMQALPIPPYSGTSLPGSTTTRIRPMAALFPKATLRERIYALNVFLRTFAFVSIRRIVDYDNMPLLTKEAGFSGLNFTTALRYISMFARIRASRMIGTLTGARRPAAPANPALLNQIKSDGIVPLTLSPDEIEQVRAVTNPGFAKLDERRAGIPPKSESSTTTSIGARAPPIRRPSRPSRISSTATASSKPPAPISAVRSA